MRRFQTEQIGQDNGRTAAAAAARMAEAQRMADSTLSDTSISGDRPLTKESGYGTAKRKRAGANRVEPADKANTKPGKSKICVVS